MRIIESTASRDTTLLRVRESGFQNRQNFACGIRNRKKFLLVECGILGFTIQNTAQGIQNPSSTDKDGNPVPGIRNPWCGIQSKTTLDSLTWGDHSRRIWSKEGDLRRGKSSKSV